MIYVLIGLFIFLAFFKLILEGAETLAQTETENKLVNFILKFTAVILYLIILCFISIIVLIIAVSCGWDGYSEILQKIDKFFS